LCKIESCKNLFEKGKLVEKFKIRYLDFNINERYLHVDKSYLLFLYTTRIKWYSTAFWCFQSTKYVYIKSTTVYVPLSELGLSQVPTPISPASVPLPPEPGGGGDTRLRVKGWGSPNSDDLRKSLALCLLCVSEYWGCLSVSLLACLHTVHSWELADWVMRAEGRAWHLNYPPPPQFFLGGGGRFGVRGRGDHAPTPTFMFWKLYVLELLHCVQLRFVTLRHGTFRLCCFTLCSNIVCTAGN
jgi:hypothetical protein